MDSKYTSVIVLSKDFPTPDAALRFRMNLAGNFGYYICNGSNISLCALVIDVGGNRQTYHIERISGDVTNQDLSNEPAVSVVGTFVMIVIVSTTFNSI